MTYISVEVADRVAVVTLDDPGRRNALSVDMNAELAAAFDEFESSGEVHAVIVTGNPPAFCAGADLSQLGASKRDGLGAIYEGFLRVASTPIPTIAAVNGAAVGAGMNMALACDVRIAGTRARFDNRFLQLALHPGGGHTWMFRRIAGPQSTAASVLFGEVLDGEAAVRAGLAWKCVDDENLLEEARALASRAAQVPLELLMKAKATIQDMATISSHNDAVAREIEPQLWSMEQPDFGERIAALQKKITSK